MGDFEIFAAVISATFLGVLIYNIVSMVTYRDLLRRFGIFKTARRDFYECGFRPQTQKPVRFPIQFLLICVFFLLYDIELIFLFPLVSACTFIAFHDLFLIGFFFLLFLLSLVVDFNRHALTWQY